MSENQANDAPESVLRQDAAVWSHVVPFVAWLFFMQMLGDPSGWKYAVRSVASLGMLLWLRPWRWYRPLQVRHLPFAFAVGVLVFVVWVFPESPWAGRWPRLQALYLKYLAVQPWFGAPERAAVSPYAPEVCGWTLSVIRLAGSAFVIAVIEEFFWRGFLYRWMLGREFSKVDPGMLDLPALAAVSVVFGLEHDPWLAGIVAGVAYALVMIRTRDIWAACVAHITTNFLLGLYVLATGAYGFW